MRNASLLPSRARPAGFTPIGERSEGAPPPRDARHQGACRSRGFTLIGERSEGAPPPRDPRHQGARRSCGFTLIELMVTVAIVAILAAIAYPSYTDYVIRGRLSEATSAMQESRVRMEQFFLDNRTYTGGCAAIGLGSAAPRGTFSMSCASADANSYTITATGSGVTNGFVYTINQANTRATTGAPTNWGTSTTCWVIKKGGGC
jgi:type IV pilus assembly protein PilE